VGVVARDWPEAADVAGETVPEPAGTEAGAGPPSPPMPFTAAQVPVYEPELSSCSAVVTSAGGPGSGKMTSFVSTVVQPLPRLATKRSGRDLKATAGDGPEPAAMVIEAQFM
jgi:hypothetical protein